MSDTPTGVLGRVVQHPLHEVEFMPAHPALDHVRAIANEVTALCPVTFQPDIYTVTIDYTPQGQVIESKALKLYLWKFRDQGISCEDLAATIAQELTDQLGQPVRVSAQQQSRGGIVLIGYALGEVR